MIYVRTETVKNVINEARERLIEHGICARDSSGDSIVEEAMNFLSLFVNNQMVVSDEEKEFECQCGKESMIVCSRGTWHFKGEPCCEAPRAVNF